MTAAGPLATAGTTRGRWGPTIALGVAVTVLLAGPNIPTPLYPTYQRVFGMSPLMITVVFAVYALVLIPALLVFGPLSDVIGRRRVLLPATGLAALGSVLFAVATGLGWLLVARAAQGVALGAAQGTASAALVDADPDGRHERAALIGALAVAGGIAVGPLLGGLLAQYAPAPEVLPYLVEAALLVAAMASMAWLLPRHDTATDMTWRPRRPSVPTEMRRRFALAGVSAVVAFAVSALFLTLMPSYIGHVAHTGNLALAGGVVAVMLGCAAAAQLPLRRLGTWRAQILGLGLLALGLAGILAAAQSRSLVVVLAATVVTGLGQGLAFGGSLGAVTRGVPAARRGDVLSSYYVLVYLGLAVPIIGIGVVALAVGQLAAVQLFAAIIIAACLAGVAAHQLDARRASRYDTTDHTAPDSDSSLPDSSVSGWSSNPGPAQSR